LGMSCGVRKFDRMRENRGFAGRTDFTHPTRTRTRDRVSRLTPSRRGGAFYIAPAAYAGGGPRKQTLPRSSIQASCARCSTSGFSADGCSTRDFVPEQGSRLGNCSMRSPASVTLGEPARRGGGLLLAGHVLGKVELQTSEHVQDRVSHSQRRCKQYKHGQHSRVLEGVLKLMCDDIRDSAGADECVP
jgi:hypothetical protein